MLKEYFAKRRERKRREKLLSRMLAELELEESRLYEQRHAIGQTADLKRKCADEQAYYPYAPGVPVSDFCGSKCPFSRRICPDTFRR